MTLVLVLAIALLILALVGAFSLAGAVALGALWGLGQTQYDLPPAEFESVARVSLPPSTRALRSRREGFQDDLVHARFAIDAKDLALLEASACKLGSEEVGPPGPVAKCDEPWWTLDKITRYRSCTREGGNFTQVMVLDLGSPDPLTVYLVLMER